MLATIITFGCQANARDSETIEGMVRQLGYEINEHPEKADLIILNTCSIREKAAQKVYSMLGTFKKLKEEKPHLIIGLCGCMSQEESTIPQLRQRHPYVSFVLGTHRLHQLNGIIQKAQVGVAFQSDIAETEEIVEHLPSNRALSFRALVNITYGCNNFCTYCIVPYVRGRERSRRLGDIMDESRLRVSEGAVEIMYLGQNVNAYGKGTPDTFTTLIRKAADIEGLQRVRYMTSHPKDFHFDLVEAIAENPIVTRHFHLPVQAGSDRILHNMNRGYSVEDYLSLIEKIKEALPEASFTTDLIVGFPGETETDFMDTLSLIEKVQYDNAYTFMYSPRENTPAAKMKAQIEEEVKKERLKRLMNKQSEISLKLHQKMVGKEFSVLMESWEQGKGSGRSETGQLITFAAEQDWLGTFIKVKVKEAQTYMLKGEVQ